VILQHMLSSGSNISFTAANQGKILEVSKWEEVKIYEIMVLILPVMLIVNEWL
jgi:hypothetical protein